MNIQSAKQVLNELASWGVTEFAVCAGARNSPLVASLSKCSNAKLYSFFEERSAGFFMLGRARATGKPTAVITTSGTAAAELLPSVVEAFYSGVPLIAVTADRPSRMRGTGAPQTIEQTNLFKGFAEVEFDIEGTKLAINDWSLSAPVHINVRFDEPLLDEKVEEWSLPQRRFTAPPPAVTPYLKLSQFFEKSSAPLVIVGGLTSEPERRAALKLLQNTGLAAYIEGQSGIREKYDGAIKSGDAFLVWALREKLFDSVLRLGSVPTARVWRDLENPNTKIPVLSLSHLKFSGLSEAEHLQGEWWNWDLDCKVGEVQKAASQKLIAADHEFSDRLEKLLDLENTGINNAEPGWFRWLSQVIPPSALVYIGNSLPIRQWDLAATREVPRLAHANRGANGIDGQISTFLGLCAGNEINEGWCIVGDLTALYDLTGPWALRSLPAEKKIRIIVINNGGGKIFNRIFKDPLFENQHDLEFGHWARMWGFEYVKLSDTSKANVSQLSDRCVIEIIPSNEQTAKFYDLYDGSWKK